MNNPNPFVPQGSLLEQKNKKRARVKFAVLAIFAANILLVGPLVLLNGCRRGSDTSDNTTPSDTSAVAADTGAPTPTPPPMSNLAPSTDVVASVPPPVAPIAPVAPPMPPAPAPSASEYTVVKGDTLATIAKNNHIKLKDLEAANSSVDPKKLKLGMKLTLPAAAMTDTVAGGTAAATDSGSTYTIKSGDNLTKIATAHGTTVKELMALNSMKSTAIKAGEKIKVPEKNSTATAPMESAPATTTASNPMPGAPVTR